MPVPQLLDPERPEPQLWQCGHHDLLPVGTGGGIFRSFHIFAHLQKGVITEESPFSYTF